MAPAQDPLGERGWHELILVKGQPLYHDRYSLGSPQPVTAAQTQERGATQSLKSSPCKPVRTGLGSTLMRGAAVRAGRAWSLLGTKCSGITCCQGLSARALGFIVSIAQPLPKCPPTCPWRWA